MPVFAWKGETLEEYWWCTEQALRSPTAGPNMILDDGGDATLLVHKGVEYEARGPCPTRQPRRTTSCGDPRAADALAGGGPAALDQRRGRGDGCDRGDDDRRSPPLRDAEQGELLFPAINVNDSVTKSKFDNLYGCRHSLVDGINRATDVMHRRQGRRRLRLRRRRQGLRRVAAGQGARVIVTEIDPICALQAAMQGYQVPTLEDVVETRRHLHHGHRQQDIITVARHGADEAPGDRRQHRPLRQRDRHGRAGGLPRDRADQHQAAGRQVGASPTATRSSCCPRAGCSTSATRPGTRAS